MDGKLLHGILTNVNVMKNELNTIKESKNKVKIYLTEIVQTLEYIELNEKIFKDNQNFEILGSSTNDSANEYYEIEKEYNHEISVPIKERSELKQLMNNKYIRRIELFYQAILTEFVEWDASKKKIDAAFNKIQDHVETNFNSDTLQKYFSAQDDNEIDDSNLIKKHVAEGDVFMTDAQTLLSWKEEFSKTFTVYSQEFNVQQWTKEHPLS